MAKKKDDLIEETKKLKSELAKLKEKKAVLDSKPAKKAKAEKTSKEKTAPVKPAKAEKTSKEKTAPVKPAKAKAEKTSKEKTAPVKPAKAKAEKTSKEKTVSEKPAKEKKLTKKEMEEAKREAEKTLEEELEEQLTDEEIENFQIEKVDMERLTNRVYDILAEKESAGMLQSELFKKLKLSGRDGARLALKLERMGSITREKLLEKGRWTYKLILKKTPISTLSIENAPCLVCPVEQKCSLEGEISPRNCQFIEDWVLAETKKPAKA